MTLIPGSRRRRIGTSSGSGPWFRVTTVVSVLFLACSIAALAVAEERADDIVARVNGQPVHTADVAAHLRQPPPWVGAERPADPRRAALDKAIGVRLLAQEAERRGIQVTGDVPQIVEAKRVQALIRSELGTRHTRPEAVDDAEARAFYERHADRLAAVESVTLAAVVLDEEELAEQLLEQAAAAGVEKFAELASRFSVDPASRAAGGHLAVMDEHGNGVEEAVARVAFAMRSAGTVGLARGADGRYYVLRATAVRLREEPWSESVCDRVRNLIVQQRREAAVQALVAQLRQKAEVMVDEAVLNRLAAAREETSVNMR